MYTLHHGSTDFQHWIRHIPSIRGGARLFRVCRRSSSLLLSLLPEKKRLLQLQFLCYLVTFTTFGAHHFGRNHTHLYTAADFPTACFSGGRCTDMIVFLSPASPPFFFFKAFGLLRPRRSVPIKHHHTLAGYASATQ